MSNLRNYSKYTNKYYEYLFINICKYIYFFIYNKSQPNPQRPTKWQGGEGWAIIYLIQEGICCHCKGVRFPTDVFLQLGTVPTSSHWNSSNASIPILLLWSNGLEGIMLTGECLSPVPLPLTRDGWSECHPSSGCKPPLTHCPSWDGPSWDLGEGSHRKQGPFQFQYIDM